MTDTILNLNPAVELRGENVVRGRKIFGLKGVFTYFIAISKYVHVLYSYGQKNTIWHDKSNHYCMTSFKNGPYLYLDPLVKLSSASSEDSIFSFSG